VNHFQTVGYDWTTTLVEQFSKISKVIIGYPETSPSASRVKDGHQDEA